jgi:hypothetical protein
MTTKTFQSRVSGPHGRDHLPEPGVDRVDDRRLGLLRARGSRRGAAHDALVQKVLERLAIDQARRLAL